MKLGIIGPKQMVSLIHNTIKTEYSDVQLIDLIYNDYSEAPKIVFKNQAGTDALLFCGKLPFKAVEALVKKEVPWAFLPRTKNTLFRAMLEAHFTQKYDIKNISIDTYDKDLVYSAYKEIGVSGDNLDIYIAEQRILEYNYNDYLCEFHLHNYREHGVSCIISGANTVYHELLKMKLPCILTIPAEDVILSIFNQLHFTYLSKIREESQIVVIAVQVDTPSIYSVNRNDEYMFISKNMKILEKIYLFASHIDAAVVCNNQNEFLLFTTKKILESATNNLESIYLLDLIRDITNQNINIGIGYGKTVREAKFNAFDGVIKSKLYGGNVAYAVIESGEVIGPLRCVKNEITPTIDKEYLRISSRTGISTNTAYKIYMAIDKFNNREFTSKEMADVCGMSHRNMDRIISRLIDCGFCKIVGERIIHGIGRPSRILKLLELT
ncbi:MAG: hypothetical protein VB106_19410 [Clostridiaceae bacterium]|nr:hypothetical protein [Clostridiaceae bacterium]